MDAIRQTALVIGKDIAIVGFDDIELAEFTTPPLTTIRQLYGNSTAFSDIGW